MNMAMPRSLVAALVLVVLALAACSTGPSEDPYADPDVAPPPPVEDPTVATSGSVAPREGSDLVDINVAGFLAPEDEAGALRTAQAIPELDEGDFTVVEAGKVQGITVEKIGGDVRAGADIAFVLDTTGSMGGALATMQESIIEFVDHLDGEGLDVRVGAVTYGDAFDTGSGDASTAPPSFDSSARPVYPLTDDLDAFKTFIDEENASGGGDGAENGVGALAFAYDELEWRPGAQRIMVVITDIYSHNDESFDFADGEPDYEGWIPEDPEELLARLRANATVHVVAPEYAPEGFALPEEYTDMAMFAGTAGTGGEFVPFDEIEAEEASLTDLDITAATAGGYIVTFRGEKDGEPKEVRVVIDDGSDVRGEFSLTASY